MIHEGTRARITPSRLGFGPTLVVRLKSGVAPLLNYAHDRDAVIIYTKRKLVRSRFTQLKIFELTKRDPMNKRLNYSIRAATLRDAQAIAETHIRSWQGMYKEFIPESILNNLSIEEKTLQWQELLQQGIKVLVLEVEGNVIGFASVCRFRDSNADDSSGEISAIYLDPNYWRKGLGTKLCVAAISALEALGYKKIFLWVLEGNTQARKFYESLNFKATHSTKLEEFYEGGALLTEILYQK
ncbi:GNAT family acetyltransferase [Legionella maceachernii]|uniref:GNAT family acetyltransferase n=2 Tax=Legionella maceachernii TaxID=466 RepID=A0A0W0VY02_9GAMM|nr:GNAT family acetyltransferase [Legionella maceachernii]SKA22432.1 L-amino acid N-acyltransferase YncA [Legionella maceachernii]